MTAVNAVESIKNAETGVDIGALEARGGGIRKKKCPQQKRHILVDPVVEAAGPEVDMPEAEVIGGVSTEDPDVAGPAPDPPTAVADNWANPIEPGVARYTEYTFF